MEAYPFGSSIRPSLVECTRVGHEVPPHPDWGELLELCIDELSMIPIGSGDSIPWCVEYLGTVVVRVGALMLPNMLGLSDHYIVPRSRVRRR